MMSRLRQYFITGLLIAPMVVPIVVVGVSTYLFFARIGINDTYLGLVLVHAALGAPFVVTTVLATLHSSSHSPVCWLWYSRSSRRLMSRTPC